MSIFIDKEYTNVIIKVLINLIKEGMNIKPLYDNVVVKQDDVEKKSKGGIILGTDENPALTGVVQSVGKEVEDVMKKGDKIMYAPFSGREFGEFLILGSHDVMGIIEE